MEVSKKKLGDLLVNYDYLRKPLSSLERQSFQGDYPYYGAQGIIDHVKEYRYDGEFLLIAEDGENLSSRTEPIAQIAKGKFWVNNHAHVVQANKDADIHFICYALNHSDIAGYVTGSAQPKLSQANLNKITLIVPNLNTQRRIASILSAYDNLIENNTRRIRLLEQMAENLYKEWFVRFRFPGYDKTELVDSKLGKLPNSFQVTNMGSVFDDYIGGGWGNDEASEEFPIAASVIRGADFPNVWHYDLSTCPRRYHKTSNYKSRQLQDGDIVMEISGGTSEQPVGRTVLVTQDMIDRFEDGRVICASFCKMIRLKKDLVSPYFFYYWMHYMYDTRIIDRFQLQSTGIINFKFEPFLKKGLVMLPPKETQNAFEKQVVPLIKEINQLAVQIDNLSRQRDLLLPRLMSGKLEVKG